MGPPHFHPLAKPCIGCASVHGVATSRGPPHDSRDRPSRPPGAMERKWSPMELKWSPVELKWGSNGAQRSSNGAQMEPSGAQMKPKWSPMELKWSPVELKWGSNAAQWISNGAQWSSNRAQTWGQNFDRNEIPFRIKRGVRILIKMRSRFGSNLGSEF